jgi:hypothetical protein
MFDYNTTVEMLEGIVSESKFKSESGDLVLAGEARKMLVVASVLLVFVKTIPEDKFEEFALALGN